MSAHVIPFPGAGSMPIDALPLEAMLSTIPSLPRAVLARLTARMIDRLDEIDGDPDAEDDDDCCTAGDDAIIAGPAFGWQSWDRPERHVGCEDDAEPDHHWS